MFLNVGATAFLFSIKTEYIWSAASGQPFDTCHVQVDWWDREAWFIQDHSTGTVRGFTDANGEMVNQYRFDAFGNLRSVDTFPLAGSGGLFSGFRNRLGHQGLFAERVDSHTTALTLHTSGELWYQSRSRWYVPELGRFMTSDPNATGVPVVEALASMGRAPAGAPEGVFGWEAHYGDGWDTYTAYAANPIMYQDATGLFFGYAALGVGTGLDFGVSAFDSLGEVQDGYVLFDDTDSMMSDYAMNQLADVEWALDMSAQNVHYGTNSRMGAGLATLVVAGWLKNDVKRMKPLQDHHILTKEGVFKAQNKTLLARCGMDLDDPANIVRMHHSGRHSPGYHLEVRQGAERIARSDMPIDQKRRAMRNYLSKAGEILRSQPD